MYFLSGIPFKTGFWFNSDSICKPWRFKLQLKCNRIQNNAQSKLWTRKLQSSFDLDYSTTLFNRCLNWPFLSLYIYSLTLFRSYYFWSLKNKSTENWLHWSRKFTAFILEDNVWTVQIQIYIRINSTVLYIFLALALTNYRVGENSTEATLIQHIWEIK